MAESNERQLPEQAEGEQEESHVRHEQIEASRAGENAYIEDMISNINEKSNFALLNQNLERLQKSKDILNQMLQTHAIEKAVGKHASLRVTVVHGLSKTSTLSINDTISLKTSNTDFDNDYEKYLEDEDEEEVESLYDVETCESLSDDTWLGYFKDFNIVTEQNELIINEGKQCIELTELTENEVDSKLMTYLKNGINCFMIDMFKGTDINHQNIILKLHKNELKVSQKVGYPVISSLFALLTPRLQYTGILEEKDAKIMLNKGDNITLTTKRIYSNCSTSKMIYVNGRFIIPDCKIGDFMLIGPSIQVTIEDIQEDELHCIVRESGELRSHLPVRFPSRCNCFYVSVEEMEDITFAREVGITTIISYAPGSEKYFDSLNNCLQLLNCETMRLGTRIVLNDPKSFHEDDLPWIAQKYDAFLLDFTGWQSDECHDKDQSEIESDILKLTPAAVNFVKTIYELKKPIILNAKLFRDRVLLVHPENIPEIFYYPDRYLFSGDSADNWFYFNLLQWSMFQQLSKFELQPLPYCDKSHVGSDSLARSCVTACFENINIKAIVVCSLIADMSIKLSHFRPNIPVICVTSIKSISSYIGMYHNVTYLNFNTHFKNKSIQSHKRNTLRSLIFGITYLKLRKLLANKQQVMLVYGTEPGTKFPDKYVVYTFQEDTMATTLKQSLFNQF